MPPIGSRLIYDVVIDEKTGRPRADNVVFDEAGSSSYGPARGKGSGSYSSCARSKPYASSPFHKGGKGIALLAISNASNSAFAAWPPTAPSAAGRLIGAGAQQSGDFSTGTVKRILENFGFIEQDSGEEDMFVLPRSCKTIGRVISEVGTRIRYTTVIDEKTGRPRAEEVEFE